tara:strand:+ start:210 stop:485 length:276 start_codon:yes stop_codon:yes gene_type:complete
MKCSHVHYDWKQGGCEEEWVTAIQEMGLIVTIDPNTIGSDSYGFYITKVKPTPQQLLSIIQEDWNEKYDDECYVTVEECEKALKMDLTEAY